MRVITRRRLREFWERFPEAEEPLRVWERIMKAKSYSAPHEVKQDFSTASFLGAGRAVYNIGGNKFRLVVDMRYDLGRVYVRHVVTHGEYDDLTEKGAL